MSGDSGIPGVFPRQLAKWWERGEGAAKIRWGAPGDFDRCVRLAVEEAHMDPERAKGFCNERHHAVLGIYPATHAAEIKHAGRTSRERALEIISRVGPKGYIHGWIFVGAPGVGARVFHPQHGHGTVTGHTGTHATVRFDRSGAEHSFEAVKAPGAGRLEPRPLPEGVTITPHHSGRQHVTSPYDKAFIGGLKGMGATWSPKSKTWSVPPGKDAELRSLIDGAFGPKPEVVRSSSLPKDVSIATRANGKTEVRAPFNEDFRREARSIGGSWDPSSKSWVFPAHRDAQARDAVSRHYGDGSVFRQSQREGEQARQDARAQGVPGGARATPKQVAFALRMIAQNGGTHDLGGWSGPPPSRAQLEAMTSQQISRLISDLKSTRGW